MNKLFILFLLAISITLQAQDEIQWRGTDRTGIYHEQGLLKSWPADGPELLWSNENIGDGHSSVAISDNKIYTSGLVDGKGMIHVFDLNGKLLQEKSYGSEWDKSYNGARSTITINDGMLYVYSGTGDLSCLNQSDLTKVWEKSIITDFNGKNIRWGVNESPLVIDNNVIISPGGVENNIVSLNKKTGDLVWSSPAKGELTSYCSPMYINDQDVPQIVTITAGDIISVEASTGKLLWSYPFNNQYEIHPNTPIYKNNMILCLSGYGNGALMLKLVDGGRGVEKVWKNDNLDTQLGSAVVVDNYIYGAGHRNRNFYCLDWNTGEEKFVDRTISEANVIANDDMIYCYSTRGKMYLIKADPTKLNIVSQFDVTMGTAQHWAHPVIYNGVLYVRHGTALMAYKIK